MPWSATISKRLVLVAALSVLVSGCAQVRVWEVRSRPAADAMRLVLGDRLYESIEPLLAPGVRIDLPEVSGPELAAALALVEQARRREITSHDEAIRLYVDGMGLAYDALQRPSTHSSGTTRALHEAEARKIYNFALERFLRISGGRRFLTDESWRAQFSPLGIKVAIRRDDEVWPPERFDELRFASDFVVQGMDHHFGSNGLGVPLIAARKPTIAQRESRQGADRFLPFFEVYAVTAVVRFARSGDGTRNATLELHDALRRTDISVAGRREKLATDLTTPTAYHFTHGQLERYEKISLFTPERLSREAGVHMLHPYERGKIPVIMIHGLASSPKAWGRVVNELRGDPELRGRYQFWMYMYPTGSPFVLSAAEFRQALTEARRVVDPDGTDRACDRMVLIGHSMGGLLTRLALTDGGDEFWRLSSGRPFETIKGEPEHRDLLRRVFFFKPLPFVTRAVFIATPHRGSKLGNRLIGRIADSLIKLPGPLEQAHAALVARNEPGYFTPLFLAGVPSSVDGLRLENPYLMTLDRLGMAPWVTAHSIVGKLGAGRLAESTDGVVPYTSSHVDWAASERVVPRNHACQDAPETIEELRRILFLHFADQQ
jgi:pimeloyl-ACP methyl ester carboxylesterase